MIATIIIPVGPGHESLSHRAVHSAQAQSIPCAVRVIHDTDRRGPGWARNRGAEGVETPFVVFLDADDELLPTFVEQCARAYQRGRYLYTGWWWDERSQQVPAEQPFANGGFHLVTTLLPTQAFHAVGGFDETLPGYEDTDLYLRLMQIGVCGLRVPEPLVRYHRDGQRSASFLARPDHRTIIESRGQMSNCGCGAGPLVAGDPTGQREGDVLATALWPGVRTEPSRADSTRVYRGGNGGKLWINPQDAALRPDLFRVVPTGDYAPDVDAVLAMVGAA